jgi:nucleoside-diphosphate-sugar epimerase
LKIGLFGAAGAIGGSIADALRAGGRRYRVVGRNRGSLEKRYGKDPLAEIAIWNPEDSSSVRAACRGLEAMVYLVGVDYWKFELHPRLMKQTLEGAIAEGVPRVLLIGTVYPYGRPQAARVREDHPREPHTFKGRMRKAQEDLLLEADAAGRVKGCVLRLPDFYGPGVDKSFLHGAVVAAVRGGAANMIGPIDRPHEFVFVPDVGPVVVKLLDEPKAFGHVWHFAGAGATTQQAVVEEIERQTRRPLKLRVAGKTLLRVIGLFNPMMREMVEMHYLLTEPVIMDDAALQRLIGPLAKTSYAEGLRRTLEFQKRETTHAS